MAAAMPSKTSVNDVRAVDCATKSASGPAESSGRFGFTEGETE
jgi:hypothetical protein